MDNIKDSDEDIDTMIFDSGANMSITGNESLFLTPPHLVEIPIRGITSETCHAKKMGMTAVGAMALIPKLPNTLVSHSFVERIAGYEVDYQRSSNTYSVTTPENQIDFLIEGSGEARYAGLPVARLPKNITSELKKRATEDEEFRKELDDRVREAIKDMDIAGGTDRATALITLMMDGEEARAHHVTAREDLRKYNILTRVHEALNHPSDEAMRQMIKYGTFAENDRIRKGRAKNNPMGSNHLDLNSLNDRSNETNQHFTQLSSASSSPLSPLPATNVNMEEEGRLLRPHDVDIWREVAGKCAVCEIGKGSIRHRQLKGKYSSATQYPVGKMWHGDIVFLSTTRGAINFLVATEHQTGYTFHTLMEGGRTTATVAQVIQKLIEFCKQHQLVVGEIHFDNEGALQGRSEAGGVHISTGISGHHEVTVETKVETIRKAIKTLLVSIPYRIPAV